MREVPEVPEVPEAGEESGGNDAGDRSEPGEVALIILTSERKRGTKVPRILGKRAKKWSRGVGRSVGGKLAVLAGRTFEYSMMAEETFQDSGTARESLSLYLPLRGGLLHTDLTSVKMDQWIWVTGSDPSSESSRP